MRAQITLLRGDHLPRKKGAPASGLAEGLCRQDTVLSEEALARMFSRHRVSIKRAVERGELPPSVRLFGKATWTAKAVVDHLNKRLEVAKREAEQLQRRISQNSA